MRAFVEQRAALDFQPLAAATRALFACDVSTRIPALRCRVKVAVGSEDRLCSVDAAKEVASLIPGAGFEVIHMAMLEQPQAVDWLLDDFARHYRATA